MPWYEIAQVKTFSDLQDLVDQGVISDRELKKGDRVRIEFTVNPGVASVAGFKVPYAELFDLPGAEKLFKLPEGMDMVDVHSTGPQTAEIEMEADPAFLAPLLGFVAVNWVTIFLFVLLLAAIVISIRIMIKTSGQLEDYVPWFLVAGGVLLLAPYLQNALSGRRRYG